MTSNRPAVRGSWRKTWTVAIPVTFARNGILNVGSGSNLTVSADLTTNNVSLTKIGGGTATVTNVRTGSAGVAVDSGTLKILSQFLPVPTEAITAEFAAGATPVDFCARTIRTLMDRGVRHFYVSNLPLSDAGSTMSAILARVQTL